MMGLTRLSLAAAFGVFGGVAIAQFPPTPSGVTVLDSQLEEGIKISYKEVNPSQYRFSEFFVNLLLP